MTREDIDRAFTETIQRLAGDGATPFQMVESLEGIMQELREAGDEILSNPDVPNRS